MIWLIVTALVLSGLQVLLGVLMLRSMSQLEEDKEAIQDTIFLLEQRESELEECIADVAEALVTLEHLGLSTQKPPSSIQ